MPEQLSLTAVIGKAITEHLNARGVAAGCTPIASWLITGQGTICAYVYGADVARVLAEWAEFLSLLPEESAAGSTWYSGVVDGFDVAIWGVTDQKAFRARSGERPDR